MPLLLELEFVRAEQSTDPYGFRFAPQEYLLRSAGGGVEGSSFPWNEGLLSDLAAVRIPGRDPVIVARLGEALRRFLKPMGWARYEEQLRAAVNEGRPVLLTIRSAAAELYSLPWELLTLSASGQHLGELPGVLLRYEWPETHSLAQALPAQEQGRILFAWSAAAGSVPAEAQRALISRACDPVTAAFDGQRDVVAHASCGRLSQAMHDAQHAGAPVAVLHLLCHGGASGTTFGLMLDGEEAGSAAVMVDGGRLRQLLAPYAKTLRLVVLSACDSGNSGALGNQLGSVAQALHRGGICAVVASRFPLSITGSIKLTEVLYRELLGQCQSLEGALLAARVALAQDAAKLDWASLQLYARAEDGEDMRPVVFRPYRGLLAFQPEHTRFFFGRETERAAVLSKLGALRATRKPRFLIVAGASGTGKSSVVRSGVIPDLMRQRDGAAGATWEVAILRPGEEPISALSGALGTRRDPTNPFLIVVDQFEEIFTHTGDLAIRRQFASELWRLAQQDSGIDCILTIRVDYMGQCGELVLEDSGLRLDRVCYQDAHQVFVAQMGAVQLRAAIEGPAWQVGLELEAGLAARMIEEIEGEPGALPLLSYTLDLLWQKRRGRLLNAQSYAELGGVSGALEGKANSVIDGLKPAEQAQARRILVRLVGLGEGASDTRRRIPLGPLRAIEQSRQASFDSVLAAFVDARLLVMGEDRGQVLLEVAHEALIRKWERLRTWLEQDREKLAEIHEVERWVAQWRSYGTLLREAQLGYALRVLEKHGEDLSLEGREMIRVSQQTEEQLRRHELAQAHERAHMEAQAAQRLREAARRLRGAAVILALALIGALAASGIARQKSRESRERFLSLLEEQGQQRLLEGDPLRAVVYLVKAYQEGSTGVATTYPLAAATAAAIDPNLFTLVGHTAPLRAVAWSPDGSCIATASDDQTVRLWDARNGQLLRTLSGHDGPVGTVAFSPDGTTIASASYDHTTRLWDRKSGEVLLTLAHETDVPFSVAFSPDGAQFITAGTELIARLWDRKSGSLRLSFIGHTAAINAARFSADGKRLITASSDKTAKLWEVESGENILTLSGHSGRVASAAFSPDGTQIITTSSDKTAKIWDAQTGKELRVLSHQESVEDAAFSPDGQRIMTASVDLTAKLWDAGSGLLIKTLVGHSDWIVGAAFSPDASRVVTASRDQSARVWDLTRGPILLTHAGIVNSAQASPDGTRIATASSDKTARIWEAGSGRPVGTFSGHTEKVVSADFNPDGTRIVTASADKSARIWECQSGKQLLSLSGHGDRLRGASFSPDGTRILTVSRDRTARIWDAQDGKLILILTGHSGGLLSGVWSRDGRQILTASEDKTARVWDAKTGQVRLVLTGHAESVSSATYSPDSHHILTGSYDKTARLWDAKSGRQLDILAGHADKLNLATFSPDGRWVATASFDKTVRIWDFSRGKLIVGLTGHSAAVNWVSYSPDGKILITASSDWTVRLRPLAPESREAELLAKHVRCLIPYRFISDQVVPAPTEPSLCLMPESR